MKILQDVLVENKKVLLRADFNVAVENGKVKEKFKLQAIAETLKYLLEKNNKIAMMSHFGRPAVAKALAGKPERFDKNLSLVNLAGDLEEILQVKIVFVDDCVGEKVQQALENLQTGEVLLLENVRFYPKEEKNEEGFAKKLAESFEVFVNDAFGVCHRDQASVTGVPKFLPSCAGFWLQKEIENLEKIKNNPVAPAVAIIGGAKIETKLPVIKFFEEKCDHVLIGGKIANEALDQKIAFSPKVILPEDFVDDRLDIGPKTRERFCDIIASAGTIVWNGPVGKFEEEKYSHGTQAVFEAILKSSAFTLAGGGETLEILEKNNATSKFSFVSTGGGAMLEFLAGGKMPGIEVLEK